MYASQTIAQRQRVLEDGSGVTCAPSPAHQRGLVRHEKLNGSFCSYVQLGACFSALSLPRGDSVRKEAQIDGPQYKPGTAAESWRREQAAAAAAVRTY